MSPDPGHRRRAHGVAMAAVLVILPPPLFAQIPGASRLNVDVDVARARAAAMAEARTFLDALEDAWRGRGDAPPGHYYLDAAALSPPGGPWIGGGEIGAFADAAREAAPNLRMSIVDFEHSEAMAYLFGTWEAERPDGTGESGRHVTMLMKTGDEWRIRAQLFVTDSLGPSLLGAASQPEPLPSLSDRIDTNLVGRAGSTVRRSAYSQAALILTELRRAWNTGNSEAVARVIGPEALVDLPMGRAAAGDVGPFFENTVFLAYRRLTAADLDFDVNGSLVFVSGRYLVEQRAGRPRLGTWLAVLRNGGSGWQIRTIVFS